MRLWEKGIDADEAVLRYTVGDDWLLDARLVPHDIRASRAHARMLSKLRHLTAEEFQRIDTALDEILAAFEKGEWSISREEEDAHTALENQLTLKLGDLGGKIHLGRSRNDQVLTALRLALRDLVGELRSGIESAAKALEGAAENAAELPIPGYTHMQRAMPNTVREWALSHRASLLDSLAALDGAEHLLSLNPLGTAAGYGAPGLNLDREMTTAELGFRAPQEPAPAAQLSRGKAEAALAFACVLILQDLGRLSSDICLYVTSEFGFLTLAPEFTTGSSIMPQKRNPDVFELIRGASGQAPASLIGILGVTSKMTSGYHRDLQLLKKPLFEIIDQTLAALAIVARAVPGIRWNPARLNAAMTDDLFAAERAFELVKSEGISFREAYRRVAESLKPS